MRRTEVLAATLMAALLSLNLAQAQTAAPAPVAPAMQAAPAAAPTAAPAADASEGKIAYYGNKFAGRKTASGQRFNPNAMTMAHKSLPFGTRVKVTNLVNKRSVVLRVNDRGPTTPDRIGDVSAGAARKLAMLRAGVVNARIEVLGAAGK